MNDCKTPTSIEVDNFIKGFIPISEDLEELTARTYEISRLRLGLSRCESLSPEKRLNIAQLLSEKITDEMVDRRDYGVSLDEKTCCTPTGIVIKEEFVASGGYNRVHRGKLIQTSSEINDVAIRVLTVRKEKDRNEAKQAILYRSTFNSENIQNIPLATFEDDETFVRVDPWMDGNDLWKARKRLSYAEKVSIFLDVAKGLEDLHRAGFVHCDIKPQNILISKDNKIKIADIETIGKVNDDSLADGRGTVDFMPYELMLGKPWSTAGDIYSFGVTMNTMLHPSEEEKLHSTFKKVSAFPPWVPDTEWKGPTKMKEFISKMLSQDPNERPTASEVVNFLSKLNRL